jgi:hypothetical protein
MRYSFLLASLAVLPLGSASHAVEPGDLRPGLIASFTDTHASDIHTARLEPTVAISLARGESPHPRLENGGLMTWEGYVNIVRPGKYRFEANVLAGQLQVKINRKAVLTGTARSTGLTALAGKEVTLDGGVQPINIIFLRASRDAATRIELFWSGPGFIKEPLNGRYLGHLPTDRKDWFHNDVREEHGRVQLDELR